MRLYAFSDVWEYPTFVNCRIYPFKRQTDMLDLILNSRMNSFLSCRFLPPIRRYLPAPEELFQSLIIIIFFILFSSISTVPKSVLFRRNTKSRTQKSLPLAMWKGSTRLPIISRYSVYREKHLNLWKLHAISITSLLEPLVILQRYMKKLLNYMTSIS